MSSGRDGQSAGARSKSVSRKFSI